MIEEQREQVEQALELARKAILQSRRALKLDHDEEEQKKILREAWLTMTDAGALLFRSRIPREPDKG